MKTDAAIVLLLTAATLCPLAAGAALRSTALFDSQIGRELGVMDALSNIPDPASVPGRPLANAATLDDIEDLYVHGALVVNVYGPRDQFSRRISLKVLPVRQSNGTLRENLFIYDITDWELGKPDMDIFSQHFPLEHGNWINKTFPLDDRTPGKREYVLRIWGSSSGDVHIEFGRPGNERQINVTMQRLLQKRAAQVIDEGVRVTINEHEFLALGFSGGGIGSLLYFPADLERNLDSTYPADLAPKLMAELTRFPEGRIAGQRPLGWVGDKYYYLVWNQENRYWAPVEGDPPPSEQRD